MDFSEIMRRRQSCRDYDTARPVEREKLEQVLEAACLSPSARNRQPWHFTVMTNDAAARVADALKDKAISRFGGFPPVFVVISSRPTEEGERWIPTDIGLSTAYMTARATELGLSSCILGWFDEEQMRTLCGVTEPVRLIVALGYASPSDPLREKDRRAPEDSITWRD